jgi:hypothetical protein
VFAFGQDGFVPGQFLPRIKCGSAESDGHKLARISYQDRDRHARTTHCVFYHSRSTPKANDSIVCDAV